MIINKETVLTKDLANKKLIVVREFEAPPEQVWKAWTESELLDQWWAPKPWKAQTKTMNFKEGGFWLYQMVGPDGTGSWCRADFKKIDAPDSFLAVDNFCDESGKVDANFPSMYWTNVFSKTADGTTVKVEISFDTEAGLEKILELGFEEGFTAALGNLDELLAK
ncbi:SRPBCC family protein [Terrimonas pollutisoli]|uniref:SRPBCC family protein n=1 Tax=Terrimonas pollutisoli TaxID=3034147 RepID=UPI0023EB94B1|nr:SRPBCC domain-containing protein [Terrimonas sp. H1YJ31]